jgi:hypothetical protein
MNTLEKSISSKTVLQLGYLFIFLILIDVPLVILYSLRISIPYIPLVPVLLYFSEATILATFFYLLFRPSQVRPPAFIYLFVVYILLLALVGVMFGDVFDVLRDARRYLAPLPPLLLGYYFARSFGEEREKFVNKIVMFLTILSAISLAEWALFYLFPDIMVRFCSRFFQTGPYFASIKHTSNEAESGLLTSGLAQNIFVVKMGFTKRATGLYLEPYSAGFNAATAILLILYGKIVGYRLKKEHIFVMVNLAAVILATSRSAYLYLFITLLVYLVIQRKPNTLLLLCVLPFLYGPFRNIMVYSTETLGGGIHEETIVTFPDYLFGFTFSFDTFAGTGLGTFAGADMGAIKEISIQLGLVGLLAFLLLYYSIMTRIPRSKENKFIISAYAITIFLLSIYSGRMFGYKCLGLIQFFLGYITTSSSLGAHTKMIKSRTINNITCRGRVT